MSTDAIMQQKLRQYPTYKSLANAFVHIHTHDKNTTTEQVQTNTITNNPDAQSNTNGVIANDDNII